MESFDFINKILEETKIGCENNVSSCKIYEDLILKNISMCTESQKNYIINGYTFIYYSRYNGDRSLIKTRILNEERTNKLKEILK